MNPGFEYLKKRGFTKETVESFHLMYFDGTIVHALPSSQAIASHFRATVIEPLQNSSRPHRWDNCIVLPIFDLYLTPVAFYARRLHGEPKFDATVFSKQSILYGLHKTCKYILEKDKVFLTEGIFDFLMLWQKGIRNAACVLGTHLSFTQMCLALRFTKNFSLVFDPDNAGRTASIKVKSVVMKHGVNCSNVILDEACDLDDYLLKFGAERFLRHAKNSR